MSFFDFLALTPKTSIGGIVVQASLEEIHSDSLQVTEHPVELGAPITDHSFNRPSEVVIKAGWSNSSFDALVGAVTSFFASGEMSQADYVADVYSQLLALKESRQPFDITTSRRQYTDMLMTSLAVSTDNKTGQILAVTATCRQVILVSTKATTLPPTDAQESPEDTAEVEDEGVKQPTEGDPSPGGDVPKEEWV